MTSMWSSRSLRIESQLVQSEATVLPSPAPTPAAAQPAASIQPPVVPPETTAAPAAALEEAAVAPTAAAPEEPAEKVVVTTAQQLQTALELGKEHIEVQEHLMLYDLNTSHNEAPDTLRFHSDVTINARLQVPSSVKSIQGNCSHVFDGVIPAQSMDMLNLLEPKGTQCLLMFHLDEAKAHNVLLHVLERAPVDPSAAPSEDPLLLENMYVANYNALAADVPDKVFLWSDRDLAMAHGTMHGRDSALQAVVTEQRALVEDCVFTGFAPVEGRSVVTAARQLLLRDCNFTGSNATGATQGLVGSYNGAKVGVEGIVNSTDCCGEWRYYNYSPDIAATVIYTSDASADVFEPVGGGQGTSWTQPLQSFPAPSALQNSTDVLRREVLAVTPVPLSEEVLEPAAAAPDVSDSIGALQRDSEDIERGYTPDPAPAPLAPSPTTAPSDGGGGKGTAPSAALLASVACAVTFLAVVILVAICIWRRQRHRSGSPPGPSEKEFLSRQAGAVTDSAVLDFMHPTSTLGHPSSVLQKKDSTTMSLLLEGTSEGRGQCIRATATSRDPLDTLSVTSTNRPSMPCNDASSSKRKNYLEYQLDSLRGIEVLGGLRFLPGLDKRLNGGQSVVQIAEDIYTQQQYAVKFFLSQQAFEQEALLYEDPTQPLGRFLPECRAIADPTVGRGCTDKRGNLLPPCIVMEKGEALDKWAARSEEGLDFVTGLQVLTHVAERLKDLHAAGYVHRDIKPGNIMWLPRKNRWTLIDFGCAAKTGTFAFSGFSVYFAPPELLAVFIAGQGSVQATEALDAWSLGILALEMFSGRPVWHHKTCNKHQVVAQIVWGLAPWENPATAPRLLRKLGHFRSAILSLLDRDPLARPSMAEFKRACNNVLRDPQTLLSQGGFSGTTSNPVSTMGGFSAPMGLSGPQN